MYIRTILYPLYSCTLGSHFCWGVGGSARIIDKSEM